MKLAAILCLTFGLILWGAFELATAFPRVVGIACALALLVLPSAALWMSYQMFWRR